jgi:hypothetical protein
VISITTLKGISSGHMEGRTFDDLVELIRQLLFGQRPGNAGHMQLVLGLGITHPNLQSI